MRVTITGNINATDRTVVTIDAEMGETPEAVAESFKKVVAILIKK